jgi:hypothetical protein
MRAVAATTLALGMLIGGHSAAQPSAQAMPGPWDFALQMPLTVSGNNGVVQFKLPLSIYLHSRMAELADLRLFDSDGFAVPYAWHRPSADRTASVRQSSVRMFPVHAAVGAQQQSLQLWVRPTADGSLISLQTPATGQSVAQPTSQLRALILDTGAAQAGEVLESIQLLLPPERGSYQAVLSLAQSDDLKLWDVLAQSRLDWLSAASGAEAVDASRGPTTAARLVNDRIAFGFAASRYLRIEWLEGEPLEFAGVLARWQSTQSVAEPLLELKLAAQSSAAMDGDWVYRSRLAIAATQVGLELPTANTVLPVQIGSYRNTASSGGAHRVHFVPQLESVFYRLLRDGVEQRSSRLSTAPMAVSEWVVRPARPHQSAPELVLAWPAHTLVFTASGKEFILAVGADRDTVRSIDGATAIEGVAPGYSQQALTQLEQASAGPPSQPASFVTQTYLPEQNASEPLAQRRIVILWIALLSGVAVLGWMTWRLFVQMNRPSAGKNDPQ